MSVPLTPEQQRQIRARLGSEIQQLSEWCADHQTEVNLPERYRAAMVTAAQWLREGAPGRALDVLEQALRL